MLHPFFTFALAAADVGPAGERAVDQIEELDLAELLEHDAEVTVTSSKGARLRDSPGVVTVMERDEILQLGARDLSELLPFVPGFDLASDVFAVTGASFRGLWGYEGKILVLVDGIEVNDTTYGSVPLFARYSLDDVERVEFLRGPGSARFGGYAGLAVIHIHTRSSAPRRGVDVTGTYGQAATDAPFRNQSLTVAGGGALGEVELAAQAHAGTRTLSLREYVDPHGVVVPLRDASGHQAVQLLGAATTSWAQVRLMLEHYDVADRTGYINAYPRAGRNSWQAAVLDARFPVQVADTVTVTPRLVLQRQLPWRPGDGDFDFEFREVNDRARAGVGATWQALSTLDLAAGVELTGDSASVPTALPRDADLFRFDYTPGPGVERVDQFLNGAAWGELSLDAGLFLLTAGARGEQHSVYGGSFVPRVALTRAFDGAHVKLLVAGAFRAPSIDNIRAALSPVRPERTAVLEAEVGARIVDSWYLTLNAFDITLRDALLYVVNEGEDEAIEDGYKNLGLTASRGVEATLMGGGSYGRLEAAWSFATPAGQNEIAALAVPGDPERVLAMPQHRLSFLATAFLARGVTATVHGVLRSPRAAAVAIQGSGADERSVIADLPATAIVGATLRVVDVLVPGVDLTAGVKNLLGDDDRLAQPYAPAHAPVPYGDRELFVRLSGHFGAAGR